MMGSRMKTTPLARGEEKVQEIFGFSGLHDGMRKAGMLLDCANVQILPGGAIASLLAPGKIDLTSGMPSSIAGVYTYYGKYDPRYEIPTTAEWVYEHICPAHVLQYADGMTAASRLLVMDVGKPPKTEEGYRKVISAFSDGENTYILYDAVYNIIDQRRTDQFSVVGIGYTVEFDARTNAENGTFTKVCTLTQVFLDVIDANGNVQTTLLDASLEEQKTLSAAYGRSLLVSTDKENYRYVDADYQPSLGAGYAMYPDKVYTEIFPQLSSVYPVYEYVPVRAKSAVRYRNRENGTGAYGSAGEKLLLLPDMRLLIEEGGVRTLLEKSETIPRMEAAVQHFERLIGIDGDTVYASAAGDCTDFTEAVDNLPASGGWQTLTADPGGFTAVASFDGKAIIFTASSMMTVRGVDLPFTLSFEGSFGCNGQESLAVCGEWLYFASPNGVHRYNGSRVETISHALPQDICFRDVTLSTMGSLVLVRLSEYDGVYVYTPASGAWSHVAAEYGQARLVSRSPGVALLGKAPYRMLCAPGDFCFSVALGGSGRRRIRSVALTARLALSARLALADANGKEIGYIDGLHSDTVTRTFLLRGGYADGGELRFSGSGGMTLYGVRITYDRLQNAVRRLR